jgi:RNA polymerase sigma-70 factor (ECF subfamily)
VRPPRAVGGEPRVGRPVAPGDEAPTSVGPPAAGAPAIGPDERRMLAAARGDAEAFAALYDRWSGPLLRFFWHLCYDRDAAEDLLQETFLRLWRAAPRYEVRAKFSTYLFQIGKNLWLNEREKVLRRPLRISLDAPRDAGGGEEGDSLAASLDSGAPDPGNEAARGETGRRIRAAVDRLPEGQREVFVLAAIQELPYAEVGSILGIPEGTVKSRMWAAVRRLRTTLEETP